MTDDLLTVLIGVVPKDILMEVVAADFEEESLVPYRLWHYRYGLARTRVGDFLLIDHDKNGLRLNNDSEWIGLVEKRAVDILCRWAPRASTGTE